MRVLIVVLVAAIGLLNVLNDELKTFTAPKVPDSPVMTVPLNLPVAAPVDAVVAPPAIAPGAVTDVERFQLISAAGCVAPCSPITMVALSIAEDGSGNPSIVSPPNKGLAAGTVDIGIWQINSAHIGQCGIQSMQWLFDPMNNARAAMCILGPNLNYCAWSTFEASCGPGHTSAYRAFLGCATQIAQGGVCQH